MGRIGRVALGVGLLGLGAWSLVPGMIHPISTDAVVNADVVTLRAAVEGELVAIGGPAVGERVAAGQVLARVAATRPETGRLDALTLELAAARRLAQALSEEEADLARLDADLARRGTAYRGAAQRQLALARDGARADLAAAQADQIRTEGELNRKRSLAAKDLAAPVAVQAAEADQRAAKAATESARAELARVSAERQAVATGIFVAGGGDDAPYADQRRDEIRIKRAARRVDFAQVETRVAELARQLAGEQDQSRRMARAELAAPAAGVVWQRFAAAGDTVRPGDPVFGVVDCDRLFLTAVLPRRYFSQMKAGDRAQARLSGVAAPVRAVVQSVRAAGGGQANSAAAVAPAAEEGRDVVVTLDVQDERLGNRSDNLCQVGQQATVTFQMPALKPLVDAVAGVAGIFRAS